MKRTEDGFTLVEIAIALVIVGLLLGGILTPLSMQLEQRKIDTTQQSLSEAREALIGFALRNGYLPCPAVSATVGLENRAGANCAQGLRQGFLPWATLGLAKLDGWNHLLRYSVSPAFSDSVQQFKLNTRSDISVASRDAQGNLVPATGPDDVAAIIVSHGKNGYGATGEQGNRVLDAGAGNNDEKLNLAPAGRAFISRTASDGKNAPGGEFDDLVVWLSPNILFNRMVMAQKLP